MNALIRKEIRLLLWPFVAAVLLAIVPGCVAAIRGTEFWSRSQPVHEVVAEVYFVCFTLGVLMLALTTFGQEFSLRTFTLTLAQPIERKTIWRIKTTLLAGSVLLTIASVAISLQLLTVTQSVVLPHPFWSIVATIVWIAVVVCTGALCATLLFRNFLIALTLSVLLPGVLLVCFSKWIFGIHATHSDAVTATLLGIYSIISFTFARWQFMRAQDIVPTGGDISFARGRFQGWAVLSSFTRSNKYVALLRKELQMQQVAFVVAAILLLCHLASFPARALLPDKTQRSPLTVALNFVCIVWMALPLLIGSAAIADERRLGTHEMLLTLPLSRRSKLLAKLFVTLLLSFVFGAVIPYFLERLGVHLGLVTSLFDVNSFWGPTIFSLVLAVIAFFSSAIARGSLDAFCLSIVAAPLICTAIVFFSLRNPRPSEVSIPAYGLLTPYIAVAFIVPTLVWLTWRNFQKVQLRWTIVVGTWVALALSVGAMWATCSFVWNRGWERFMSLEPKHGKPVLSLRDRAKIYSGGRHATVLLPDGRIWTAEYRYHFVNDHEPHWHSEHVVGASIVDPKFLPSHWLDLAFGDELYAIRDDGTLWRLKPIRLETNSLHRVSVKFGSPIQVGNDTDWVSLVSGEGFGFAIKRDRTLWGWGHNGAGQLGPGPTDSIEVPKPVWPEQRWAKVFTSSSYCIGVKTDGTSWKWGAKIVNRPLKTIEPYDLEPSQFRGSNWTSFADEVPAQVATRDDGTLWALIRPGLVGWQPTIFGERVPPQSGLFQVGTAHDWQLVGGPSYQLIALKQDRRWLRANNDQGMRVEELVPVSRYRDWLAVSSGDALIGLATDGTISAWMRIDSYPYYTGPTRGPTWSTNIFAIPN